MGKLESDFQGEFLTDIKALFPGIVILKTEKGYLPGVPDRILLFGKTWAALEFKKGPNARRQPNQGYYVDKLGKMSYAAFVYPENRELILDELQQTFRPRRTARVSQR